MEYLAEVIEADVLVVLLLSEVETLLAFVLKDYLLFLRLAVLLGVLRVKFDILLLDLFVFS